MVPRISVEDIRNSTEFYEISQNFMEFHGILRIFPSSRSNDAKTNGKKSFAISKCSHLPISHAIKC
jgi:hypothetical protein